MRNDSSTTRPRLAFCIASRLLVAALTIVCAAVGYLSDMPRAQAQWGDSYGYDTPDNYGSQQPRRRAPVRRAPQSETQRQYYWPWDERPEQAQPRPQRVQPGYVRPRPRPPAAAERPRPPVATQERVRPERESRRSRPSLPATAESDRQRRPTASSTAAPVQKKAEPATQIVVFGDTLAAFLSKGLDEAFEENPDVAIVDRSRGDSGIVRKDVVDWAKTADEYLKTSPNVGYALFLVGANDRQAIREGDQTLETFTDKWKEVYAARVDAVVKVFTDRKIPLIWVDLPPVRGDSMSREFAAINEIARARVQAAGATFVDVWPGFVDEGNRFVASGPDVDGQDARLRTADGIHFTRAGSRKIAHFAEVELKRMMGISDAKIVEQPAEVPTAPAGPSATGPTAPGLDDKSAIDRKITAMLPSLPEPPGIPTLPVKPAAGPVVPLVRAESSPGGALLSRRPTDNDPGGSVERSLQQGIAPTPQPGRADDFRWSPGG